MLTAQELKTRLLRAGHEVYRARGVVVTMADRPRENLIMDSGVSVTIAESGYTLRFTTRAERALFPGEPDDAMWNRARQVAKASVDRGFAEALVTVRAIMDPGDETHVLDTWYEVAFEREVPDEDQLLEEVSFAMKLEKSAVR